MTTSLHSATLMHSGRSKTTLSWSPLDPFFIPPLQHLRHLYSNYLFRSQLSITLRVLTKQQLLLVHLLVRLGFHLLAQSLAQRKHLMLDDEQT